MVKTEAEQVLVDWLVGANGRAARLEELKKPAGKSRFSRISKPGAFREIAGEAFLLLLSRNRAFNQCAKIMDNPANDVATQIAGSGHQ